MLCFDILVLKKVFVMKKSMRPLASSFEGFLVVRILLMKDLQKVLLGSEHPIDAMNISFSSLITNF